jgi:hypothetical protein
LSNPANSSPSYSFQYLAPGYITNFATASAAQLMDVVVPQGYSLYNVTLSQGVINTYTIVGVQFVLEATDNSGEVVDSYQLSRGPNQPGVYLDRDGRYTVFATNQYGYSTTANFSVAQTPEPAAWSLVICALIVGLFQKTKSKYEVWSAH